MNILNSCYEIACYLPLFVLEIACYSPIFVLSVVVFCCGIT